jgi:hypothetical protein
MVNLACYSGSHPADSDQVTPVAVEIPTNRPHFGPS